MNEINKCPPQIFNGKVLHNICIKQSITAYMWQLLCKLNTLSTYHLYNKIYLPLFGSHL